MISEPAVSKPMFVTLDEAAAILRISRTTLWRRPTGPGKVRKCSWRTISIAELERFATENLKPAKR